MRPLGKLILVAIVAKSQTAACLSILLNPEFFAGALRVFKGRILLF